MRKSFLIMATALVLVMGMAGLSFGALVVDWANWTSSDNVSTASGTIGSVGVSYTGEIKFAQILGIGTNFWNDPPLPYNQVTNPPPSSDLIALVGGNATVNTIAFFTPVVNPVMAILSLGQPGVPRSYIFDHSFSILSDGPGHWGGPGTLSNPSGNVLLGDEGNGVIQFTGTISSISWTVPVAEDYHGFTVGVPVPLPGAVWLLGSGLVGLGLLRRKWGLKA